MFKKKSANQSKADPRSFQNTISTIESHLLHFYDGDILSKHIIEDIENFNRTAHNGNPKATKKQIIEEYKYDYPRYEKLANIYNVMANDLTEVTKLMKEAIDSSTED